MSNRPSGACSADYDTPSCLPDEVRVSDESNPRKHRSQDLFNQRHVVAEDPKCASARSKLGDRRRHFRIGFRGSVFPRSLQSRQPPPGFVNELSIFPVVEVHDTDAIAFNVVLKTQCGSKRFPVRRGARVGRWGIVHQFFIRCGRNQNVVLPREGQPFRSVERYERRTIGQKERFSWHSGARGRNRRT